MGALRPRTETLLPEQELVLAAARSSLTSASISQLQVPSVRTDYALALATELGIVGLVADVMRKAPAPGAVWQRAWETNRRRNLVLALELHRWTTRFSAAGIRVIALKGPALAKLAFGDVGRRDFIDLDFIVPREQFREAYAICLANQWAPLAHQASLPRDDGRLTKVTFCGARSTYSLDVHAGWQPSWGRLDTRELGPEDLVDVELNGTLVQTLTPELALLHAARHFVQHRYSLKTLIDVATMLGFVRSSGKESHARSRAEHMGLSRILTLAVDAADEFSQLGRAPSVPHGLGEPWVLANPARPERVDLWMWFDLRRGYSPRRVLDEILRTLWLSDHRVRESPEWIGRDHLVLRRLLRPLRLITLFLRSARPAGPSATAQWRTQSSTIGATGDDRSSGPNAVVDGSTRTSL